jgi:hypothetical protein
LSKVIVATGSKGSSNPRHMHRVGQNLRELMPRGIIFQCDN